MTLASRSLYRSHLAMTFSKPRGKGEVQEEFWFAHPTQL